MDIDRPDLLIPKEFAGMAVGNDGVNLAQRKLLLVGYRPLAKLFVASR